MKDFQTTPELLKYIDKAYELNNGQYSKNEILLQLVERGYNFKGETLENVMLQNTDWQNKLIDAVSKPDNTIDFSSEEWENALSFGDEQPITEGENETKEVSKDNANNYERLNDYVKRYNELVRSKENILYKYNGGEGYTPGTEAYKNFKKEIDDVNNQLKDMENSDELTSLLQSIKDNGLGAKWYESESFARNGLSDIINGVGSSFEFNTGKDDANFRGQAPVKANFKSMDNLIDTYLGSHKGENNDKKTGGLNLKNPNNIFKSTRMVDNMSFGGDVKDSEYLNRRNDTLAKHLKANGIETPEEIEEYLNKYPSWKDAKQEWKDNTVSILADKVSKLSGKKEEKPDEKTSEEVKGNDEVENKDDKNINFGTDNESPLNDEELVGKDKFWNDYWNEEEAELEKGNMNFGPDNESPLNDVIYTYNEGKEKNNKGKDYTEDTEEQTPENNKYLYLDEYIKNFDTDESRKKELESMGYKVNKSGFYEKDGVKTKVYKDGRYNPSTEEIAKGGIGTATKKIDKNSQDEIDIRLQEQGYNGPKDKEGHFIPMNEDTLNGAGDKKKEKKDNKDKKITMKDVIKVVKSSPTIKNLLKK